MVIVQNELLHRIKQEVKKKCHIQEKCTRQLALTAERNVMFRSSQTAQGQFTAASATQNEDHHADIKQLS